MAIQAQLLTWQLANNTKGSFRTSEGGSNQAVNQAGRPVSCPPAAEMTKSNKVLAGTGKGVHEPAAQGSSMDRHAVGNIDHSSSRQAVNLKATQASNQSIGSSINSAAPVAANAATSGLLHTSYSSVAYPNVVGAYGRTGYYADQQDTVSYNDNSRRVAATAQAAGSGQHCGGGLQLQLQGGSISSGTAPIVLYPAPLCD